MLLNEGPLHPVRASGALGARAVGFTPVNRSRREPLAPHRNSTAFCMIRASAASRHRWACSPRFSGAAPQTARAHATPPAHRSFLPAPRRPEASIRRTLQWRRS
jgi:hypothetical protein